MEQKIPTLVVGKTNNHIYLCHGNEVYENLTTNAELKIGKIKDSEASKYFKIPLRLNQLVINNPLVVDLIRLFKTNYSTIFTNN